MDASFQKLETVTGYLDIFNNGALRELGSAFPFPGGGGLVTGYVSIYNNPVLTSLGSALQGTYTLLCLAISPLARALHATTATTQKKRGTVSQSVRVLFVK